MQHRWISFTLGCLSGLGLMGCQSSTQADAFPLINRQTSTPSSSDIHLDPAANTSTVPQPVPLRYETYELPQSEIHTVWIAPSNDLEITLAVSEGLLTVEQQAQNRGAIAALNAGFFDPQNHLTTSHIVLDAEQVADPRQNERLVNNPDLASYLDRILNRSEFRRYACEGRVQYDIVMHNAPIPPACHIQASVGAGPQLLPHLTSEAEGFLAYNSTGEVVRDAIGSLRANARSAIGLTSDGTVVLVMVAQRPDGGMGLSLPELAEFLTSVGIERALNLDGGSSSSLYYNGETVYGRLDAEGHPIERPVKSVILVQAQQ